MSGNPRIVRDIAEVENMATERSNDLLAFKAYIEKQLPNGGANLTLDEALGLWDLENASEEDREAAVQALREALDDMRAGDTGIPAREFLADFRRKHDLSAPA